MQAFQAQGDEQQDYVPSDQNTAQSPRRTLPQQSLQTLQASQYQDETMQELTASRQDGAQPLSSQSSQASQALGEGEHQSLPPRQGVAEFPPAQPSPPVQAKDVNKSAPRRRKKASPPPRRNTYNLRSGPK